MNSVKNIEIAYYCDENENQEIVNYLDTLITGCVKHVPNQLAISIHEDMKYTFCENCESNIYSHYIEDNIVAYAITKSLAIYLMSKT